MKRHRSTSILTTISLIFTTQIMAQDIAIYRWLDENNVVHFSQNQPHGDNYSQLTTISSYKANNNKVQPPEAIGSTFEQQMERQTEEQAALASRNKEVAEKNCQAAKLNVKMLNSFTQVMTADTDGKNKILSDKEKKDQLSLSKKHIDLYCTKK